MHNILCRIVLFPNQQIFNLQRYQKANKIQIQIKGMYDFLEFEKIFRLAMSILYIEYL